MIGQGTREGGMWLQSLILSVIVHAGAGALLVAPAFDFLSFSLDTVEPEAVTLSVMDISPEAIAAAIDNPPPAEEVTPEPETPPEPEPEELAAVEPEPETPPEPEPEELAAVEPEPELEAEPIEPVEEMLPEAIAAVDPSQISPIQPEGDGGSGIAPVGTLDAVATAPVVSTATPEVAAPVAPVAEAVAAVQSLPPIVLPPDAPPAVPAVQDPEVAQGPPGVVDEFILRIRGQLALPCIVATPRRDPAGDVIIELLAANENDVNAFASELLSGIADPPVQRNVLIDQRQCPALNFIREGARYPTFPLAIAVEETSIASGDRLVGALQGAQGRFVTLIVVDDNGVVQDLAPFMSFSGDTVRFDVPMTRFGPSRDTQAILMAVATPGRPSALDTHNGFLAADFFQALRADVDRNAPLAMIPFTLR
ncbi:MAG: hypothetical protein ACRC6I_21405 [Paracoccaceae bacterium]